MALETNEDTTTTKRKRISVAGAIVGVALLIVFVGAGFYFRSTHFNALVRDRVVTELEDITGGRVELRSLQWNISKLDVEVDDITIHGLEGPNEVPYAHVDHMTIHAKIIALMNKEIGLRYLSLTHPVIHLIVYPNGSTNQPTPKVKSKGGDPIQSVFDLAIERAEIANGLLIYNDRESPFNIAANQLAASLTFTPNQDSNRRQYDLSLRVGDLNTDFKKGPALVSNLETQIALHPNDAVIKVLRWSSPQSNLEASGTIIDLHDPKINVAYNATLSAIEAARIAKIPALKSGMLGVKGKADLHGSDYAASGRLEVRDFGFRQGSTNLSGVNAVADYTIDPKRLELGKVRASLLGGEALGNIRITAWRDQRRQHGIAELDLNGFSAERLLTISNSTELKRIRVNSVISGKANAEWVGSPANARADMSLDLKSRQPAAAEIPIDGALQASYDGVHSSADVKSLDVHTRGTTLSAQGVLGMDQKQEAALQFNVYTRNLAEFDPLLAAVKVERPPVKLGGDARLNGTTTGTLSNPHLRAHLSVNNFDVEIPQAASPGIAGVKAGAAPVQASAETSSKSVHWDSLVADIDYTRDAAAVHGGTLRQGNTLVSFDANATLRYRDGNRFVAYPTKQMPLQARVNVSNATIQELQAIAGVNYPVTGTLQLHANVNGSINEPSGTANLQLSNGTAYGEPFKSLQADVRLNGQTAQVTRLYFSQDGGVVRGTGDYNLSSKVFNANVQGNGFDLSHIKQLQKPNQLVAGDAQFDVQASGTAEAPSVNAHAQIKALQLNRQPLGDLIFDAKTSGDTLHLNGGVANEITKLNVVGDVRLRGDYPGNVQLTFTDFNIDPLLKVYMPGKVQGNSKINGNIIASGPLKTPKALSVRGDIPQLHVAVENYAIDNSGPIQFSMQNQVARIDQMRLVGEGTDFSVNGTAALAGDRAIHASANGDINLGILQKIDGDITASGTSTLRVKAGGTLDRPDLQGQVILRNANVAMLDVPNGLSNMNGTLVFNQNRLVVQKLTAQTGGGQIEVGGFASYQNGILLDLTATGRGVRVRTAGVSVVADTDLRLAGTLKGATLSGDATITKFAMSQQFDLGTYIAKSKEPPTPPDPTSLANRIRLNVHVASAPQLSVVTSLATLSGDVDVTVRGTAINPIPLGRINVAEGDILLQGTKYHLERGDITFTNPTGIDPVLNVEASATIRDYDITLGFHGPMDHLSTTYRSEPPLPTADIISLLAFQRTTEEAANAPTQTSFTETAQNAVLGEALNAAVSSRIQKLFGISKVKIDPQGGGLENNKPSVTVEQSVNKKLTLTFVTYPTQANQQVIQVEYNINKNVSLVGLRDQYGVLGIDVKLRQRRR